MRTLERFGIEPSDTAYQTLMAKRGALMASVGQKFPRTTTALMVISGMSPGIIKLWHDVESGWMSEARVRPGAPPVYKSVSDEIAVAIIKKELTHEQHEQLLIPDVDIDN